MSLTQGAAIKRTDFFQFKQDAITEQGRLQKKYCTWLEYQPYKGWRVRYCSPEEYKKELKSKGLLAKTEEN